MEEAEKWRTSHYPECQLYCDRRKLGSQWRGVYASKDTHSFIGTRSTPTQSESGKSRPTSLILVSKTKYHQLDGLVSHLKRAAYQEPSPQPRSITFFLLPVFLSKTFTICFGYFPPISEINIRCCFSVSLDQPDIEAHWMNHAPSRSNSSSSTGKW